MLGYRKLIENPKRYKAKRSDIRKLQKLPSTDKLQSFTSADINKTKPSKELSTAGILMLKNFGEWGSLRSIVVPKA